MDRTFNRYRFTKSVPMREADDSLMLAVLAAEGNCGRSSVRLDASFTLDKTKRTCVIDVTTEVGQQISRIFTAFVTKQFGEESFAVEQGSTSDRPTAQPAE